MAAQCPGPRYCFASGGAGPCRAHGCRVCGAYVLADTEDWPAPLCVAHAPEPLIDTAIALRTELERLLSMFDGVHQSDCAVFNVLGRAASDSEIVDRMQREARSFCSCGYFAAREGARLRFNIASDGRRVERRDTEPVLDSERMHS